MCNHIITKGVNSGLKCAIEPKDGGAYCSKHKKLKCHHKQVEQQQQCFICMSDTDSLLNVCVGCEGHQMCRKCLLQLQAPKCPFCRGAIKPCFVAECGAAVPRRGRRYVPRVHHVHHAPLTPRIDMLLQQLQQQQSAEQLMSYDQILVDIYLALVAL